MVCIKFGVSSFHELGSGSFLNFLEQHSELMSELTGGQMGSKPDPLHAAAIKQKIFRVLSQMKEELRKDKVSYMKCRVLVISMLSYA